MDIDPNKIIPINDCKGTCKTPIGCTCGKMVDEDSHLSIKAEDLKIVTQEMVEEKTTVDATVCTCGKNPGGSCACKTSGESSGGCGCSSKKSEGGSCCSSKKGGCCAGTHKLEVYDWLSDLPGIIDEGKMIEVQFKNTRKGYYLNSNNLELYKGDIVAVEATPGHDIGEVTLTGKLVELQIRKNNYRGETKRVYRIAKPNDIEKYEEAKKREHKTMLRAREIAEELTLNMKISDVEFQGDGNKAIFYYIADERVDFRQLIKVYASEFRVKIEMKQIGARQEAGRVGGIGPCGRELCCSSSMSNFVSVSTSAARLQDIPLNPQKLAGQCGKLKCCLNFEVDVYVEAQKKLPSKEIPLETKDKTYYHFKTDILLGTMTYSTDKRFAVNLVALDKDKVYEVIRMNKRGEKPLILNESEHETMAASTAHDILDQDSIHRFDSEGKKGGRNNGKKRVKKANGEKLENKGEKSQSGQLKPQGEGENRRRNNNRRNQKSEGGKENPRRNNNPRGEKSVNGGEQTVGEKPNNKGNNRNNNRRNRQPKGDKPDAKPEV